MEEKGKGKREKEKGKRKTDYTSPLSGEE